MFTCGSWRMYCVSAIGVLREGLESVEWRLLGE